MCRMAHVMCHFLLLAPAEGFGLQLRLFTLLVLILGPNLCMLKFPKCKNLRTFKAKFCGENSAIKKITEFLYLCWHVLSLLIGHQHVTCHPSPTSHHSPVGQYSTAWIHLINSIWQLFLGTEFYPALVKFKVWHLMTYFFGMALLVGL